MSYAQDMRDRAEKHDPVIEVIKERLSIRVNVSKEPLHFNSDTRLTVNVQLLIDGEVVDSDSDWTDITLSNE